MRPVSTEKGRFQELAAILRHEDLGGGDRVLLLRSPEIARTARAGQFVLTSVRSSEQASFDPLLPRPFSLLGADPGQGTIEILYRVVGRGTEVMASLEEGRSIQVMGPLGNHWETSGASSVALVAGGVGMPPLLFLAERLAGSRPGKSAKEAGAATPEVSLFYGGRTKAQLHMLERFEAAGAAVHPCTDDGSLGHHGSCVEAFEASLVGREAKERPTVYSCGPHGMLAAVGAVAERHGLEAFVSLESPMACGIGVCRGCAVASREGGFRMVCSDGPIFAAREVAFQ